MRSVEIQLEWKNRGSPEPWFFFLAQQVSGQDPYGMVFVFPTREPAQEPPEVPEKILAEVGGPDPMPPFLGEAEGGEELVAARAQGCDHFRFFLLPELAEAAELAFSLARCSSRSRRSSRIWLNSCRTDSQTSFGIARCA